MRRRNLSKRKAIRQITALVALELIFVIGFQATSGFSSAVAQRSVRKPATMTAGLRIAHGLSRLTFSTRRGDFERVKGMGDEAFINQQLDPD